MTTVTETSATTNTDAVTVVLGHLNYIVPIFRPSAKVRLIGLVRKRAALLDVAITNLGQVPFTLIEVKSAIITFDLERSPDNWAALRDRTETLHAQVQKYLDELVNKPAKPKSARVGKPRRQSSEAQSEALPAS